MGKSLSITVHPPAQGADYLTVSDAMRQILDLVDALERAESSDSSGRRIVWRLTEAHTNSPPFTVHAEAYAINPVVSVEMEAVRLMESFGNDVQRLLSGDSPSEISTETIIPLKRALERNLNGIGRTRVILNGVQILDVVPSNAKVAVIALERLALDAEAKSLDHTRTEYGALEVEVVGISRFDNKPALSVTDRLSRTKFHCVLTEDLAKQLGPQHKWAEAWEGRRLMVWGAQHYGTDGKIRRLDAEDAEDMPWTDVPLTDLKGIDLLNGKSVSDHLRLLRGENIG